MLVLDKPLMIFFLEPRRTVGNPLRSCLIGPQGIKAGQFCLPYSPSSGYEAFAKNTNPIGNLMKHIVIAGIMCAGLMALASCGSVAVTSERPRAVTNEQETQHMNERIEKQKAERAERAAKWQ
ncbi:hypothetical protein [Rhizobium phage RHEph24]|nr:hypothetical protein [Rhizobium phage RHEph24]